MELPIKGVSYFKEETELSDYSLIWQDTFLQRKQVQDNDQISLSKVMRDRKTKFDKFLSGTNTPAYYQEIAEYINDIVIQTPEIFWSITMNEMITLISIMQFENEVSHRDVYNLISLIDKIKRHIITSSMSREEAEIHVEKIKKIRTRRTLSKYARNNGIYIVTFLELLRKYNIEPPETLFTTSIFTRNKVKFADGSMIMLQKIKSMCPTLILHLPLSLPQHTDSSSHRKRQ